MTNSNAPYMAGAFANSPVGEVRFGPGSLAQLAEILERDGIRRPVLVTGRSLAGDAGMMAALKATIGARELGIFTETVPHVPRETVIAAAKLLRAHRADAVISFGGSTQNDTAKAAVWADAEGLTAPDQFEPFAIRFADPSARIVPPMRGNALPLYAIPTTLSAGEFTNIAGITDAVRGEKQLYQDRKLAARAVLLDPELTLRTPEWLWLSSGIKAIDHCIEAWFSLRAQPITDALALEALALLFRNLPLTRSDPNDREARLQCQIGAWLSVFGLANVSLGLSHGLGHQLGGRCGVAHGYTSCILLQHVLGFNESATAERRAILCKRLEAALERPFPAADLQRELLDLVRDKLSLPWRLRDLDIAEADLAFVAEAALRDPIVATNPRPVRSSDEVLTLLKAAW